MSRAHDRSAGGHRLEQHDAERLAARGRRHVHVRRSIQLRLLVVADTPQELDAAEPACRDVAAGLAFLGPGADDEQPALPAGLAQEPIRLEQVEQPLARLVATDEQQVLPAVLPARDRDGAGEALHVDAVRDDLVLAWEELADEVPSRRGHRDPAVQTGGIALEHPAAELVRGREAREGMERGDVDAATLLEHDQRQERHERLVEVEQVELLVLEHRPDLRREAWRERQGADRAVGRDGHAHPDADDVALRAALGPVAAADDADVVAAQAQVLVQIPDVLGDATWKRVDVGRDQADLHRVASPRAVRPGRSPGLDQLTLPGGVRRLVSRRTAMAAGKAQIASRGVAPDAPAQLGPGVAAVLPELSPKGRDHRAVAVERAVVPALLRLDRPAHIGSRASRKARPALADLIGCVRVAVADDRQVVRGRKALDALVPRPAQRRGVEGLDGVRVDSLVPIRQQLAEQPALRAEWVWHERVRGDREPALLVHGRDRPAQRAQGRDALLQEQGQQVTAAGRDLLADHDLERIAALGRHDARREGRVDAFVIGDGDDVELERTRGVEDVRDRRDPVRRERVDVEVRPPEALCGRLGRWFVHAAASRPGAGGVA